MYLLRVALPVAGLVTIASPRAQAQGLDTLSTKQRAGLALARLGPANFIGPRKRVSAAARPGGHGMRTVPWVSLCSSRSPPRVSSPALSRHTLGRAR